MPPVHLVSLASGANMSAIIKCVEDLRRMRRGTGWDANARSICIAALLAAVDEPLDGRLMTERLIDYTLRHLKEKERAVNVERP